VLCKFFTAVGRYQGRKYVGPVISSVISDDGSFNSTVLTAALNWALDADDVLSLDGAVYTPGTFNRITTAFHPFVGSVQVAEVPAYQRRRRDGVGA